MTVISRLFNFLYSLMFRIECPTCGERGVSYSYTNHRNIDVYTCEHCGCSHI